MFVAKQPKSIEILFLTKTQDLDAAVWQPFIPNNIQDIHSDIKNNYLSQREGYVISYLVDSLL